MDLVVGTYLLRACADPVGVNSPAPTDSPQTLFLVETRDSFWLRPVVRNALREFPGWKLIVCGSLAVCKVVAAEFPGVTAVAADFPARCTAADFSALMFSPRVWDLFSTPYVMVFQLDTVFCPGAAAKIPTTGKDFYGASCGPNGEIINGGLSYRRVDAFRAAVTMLEPQDLALPEDVAFCRVMRRHPDTFVLPTPEECDAFAIESYGNPRTAVGIHGTDKYYCPRSLVVACLPPPPMQYVDVVSYDGEPILHHRFALLWNLVEQFVVVESTVTHSGEPRDIAFDPSKYPPGKVRHVVVRDFPPVPDTFGDGLPWVRPESRESWWRERVQRDAGLDGVPDDAMVIVGDVDEIPDPVVLASLAAAADDDDPMIFHLEMAFLVYSPDWKKREPWARAFIARRRESVESATDVRVSTPTHVIPDAGWHCSSFFDAERQVRKARSFAHREFGEVTVEDVRARLERGKDPYGRGPEHDCVRTSGEYEFLRHLGGGELST